MLVYIYIYNVYVHRKLIKRDSSGQSHHLSDAVLPLIRLLRLQILGNTTDRASNTDVRPHMR